MLFSTFKINKVWIDFIKRFLRYIKVLKNFIRLKLRKSSCVRVEILAVSMPSIHLSNKKKPHSIISTRSRVLVYITFDERTDIFLKSFLFSCWSRICIHVYTYLDYFSNFTPILTKVSIPFFLWKSVWKEFESISSNGSQDIAKSLRLSFGSSFVNLRAFAVSIPSIHLSIKKNRTRLSLPAEF